MSKQSNRRPRKLGQALESLENRQMMAGDVDVVLSGGDLYINGDAANNGILIQEIDGMIRVSGQYRNGGTTLNNGATQTYQVSKSLVDDIRIDMNAGSDSVVVNNLNLNTYSHSDLKIDTDGGSGEFVGVYNSYIRGTLDIDTDDGADDVIVSFTTTGGDIDINTGVGDDEVDLYQAIAGDDVNINTDSGHDDVALQYTWANDDIYLRLGYGNDVAWLYDGQSEDLFIYGENNDDRVTVQDQIVFDYAFIDMYSGNDDLYLQDCWVGGSKAFQGGNGADKLVASGNNFNAYAYASSF